MHTYRDPGAPASLEQCIYARFLGIANPETLSMQVIGERIDAVVKANRKAREALRKNTALRKGKSIWYEDHTYRIAFIGTPRGFGYYIAVLEPRPYDPRLEILRVPVADIADAKEAIFKPVDS